jgi:hypothetical protein
MVLDSISFVDSTWRKRCRSSRDRALEQFIEPPMNADKTSHWG